MLNRRQLLLSTGAVLAAAAPLRQARAADPVALAVERRSLAVKGRAASVYALRQPGGQPGVVLAPGERFKVRLANRLNEATMVHWHGQTPPIGQDGVPELSGPLIAPGAAVDYDFAARPGTHWMHAHQGLQEMQLLAAPLIVRRPEEVRADRQEVVILLHDFSFTPPEEILARLAGPNGMVSTPGTPIAPRDRPPGGMAGMPGMAAGGGANPHAGHGMPGMGAAPAANPHAGHAMPGMTAPAAPAPGRAMPAMPGMAGGQMDLNDVDFDAYLANDRTLDDPEVVRIERGGRVLLRIINGAAATVFFIDLGAVDGRLVAVDGNPVEPVTGRRFGMAMAQRLDIELDLSGAGAWPILAQREGDRLRTGIVLASPNAAVARVADQAASAAGAFGLELERRLRARAALAPKPADRTHRMTLTGDMASYSWTIDQRTWDNHVPLVAKQGERVEWEIVNATMMAHPMHLHGHHFQVIAIDGQPLAGALRDTIHVPPRATVRVAFDADNPGRWLIHCHNALHMVTGMMTELRYEA